MWLAHVSPSNVVETSAHALDAIIIIMVPLGIALIVWQVQRNGKRSVDQHEELGKEVKGLDDRVRDAHVNDELHDKDLQQLGTKLDEHITADMDAHQDIIERFDRHLDNQ